MAARKTQSTSVTPQKGSRAAVLRDNLGGHSVFKKKKKLPPKAFIILV